MFWALRGLGELSGWYCHRPHHHVLHEGSEVTPVTELAGRTAALESSHICRLRPGSQRRLLAGMGPEWPPRPSGNCPAVSGSGQRPPQTFRGPRCGVSTQEHAEGRDDGNEDFQMSAASGIEGRQGARVSALSHLRFEGMTHGWTRPAGRASAVCGLMRCRAAGGHPASRETFGNAWRHWSVVTTVRGVGMLLASSR